MTRQISVEDEFTYLKFIVSDDEVKYVTVDLNIVYGEARFEVFRQESSITEIKKNCK